MQCPNCHFDIAADAVSCAFCQFVIPASQPKQSEASGKPLFAAEAPAQGAPPSGPGPGPEGTKGQEPSPPRADPGEDVYGGQFAPWEAPSAAPPAPKETPNQEVAQTAAKLEQVYARRLRQQLVISLLGFGGLAFYVHHTGLLAQMGLTRSPQRPAATPPSNPQPAPPAPPAAPPQVAPPKEAPPPAPPKEASPPATAPEAKPAPDSARKPEAAPESAAKRASVEAQPIDQGEPGWKVEGQVYDMLTLKPVSGADVHFLSEVDQEEEDHYVTTDAEGRYAVNLPPLKEGTNYQVLVDHVDYADEVFDETDPPYRTLALRRRQLLATTRSNGKPFAGDLEKTIRRDFILFPSRDLSVRKGKPKGKK